MRYSPPRLGMRATRLCPTVNEPILRLYIAGSSATARRAEKQLVEIRAQIKPEWKVEVIDVLERPELAEKAGILATPTLSYDHPERSRRIVGDLGDTNRVLEFLGITSKGSPA
jgi:circadian clock protein KaiB